METLMSTVGCCCRVPGGFALRGVSVSASVYVVKHSDREAAHLKAGEELQREADTLVRCSLAVIWSLSSCECML